MAKQKRKLTPAQKAEKKRLRLKYMWVFMNGKQVRLKRPPTIDGMDVDEFIRRNADPIWLHQNEMWEYIVPEPPLFCHKDEKEILNDLFKDYDENN